MCANEPVLHCDDLILITRHKKCLPHGPVYFLERQRFCKLRKTFSSEAELSQICSARTTVCHWIVSDDKDCDGVC